jgi:hypothetical protein
MYMYMHVWWNPDPASMDHQETYLRPPLQIQQVETSHPYSYPPTILAITTQATEETYFSQNPNQPLKNFAWLEHKYEYQNCVGIQPVYIPASPPES